MVLLLGLLSSARLGPAAQQAIVGGKGQTAVPSIGGAINCETDHIFVAMAALREIHETLEQGQMSVERRHDRRIILLASDRRVADNCRDNRDSPSG